MFSKDCQIVGIKEQTARSDIKTRKTMDKNRDKKIHHWSYYHVYLNNQEVKKIQDEDPSLASKLERVIVKEIKAETLDASTSFRAKLGDVMSNRRMVKSLTEGTRSFKEAHDALKATGKTTDFFRKYKEFGRWINDPATQKALRKHIEEQGVGQLTQPTKNMFKNLLVFGLEIGEDFLKKNKPKKRRRRPK